MPIRITYPNLFLGVIIILTGCTITTTKTKNPVISDIDQLKQELASLVRAKDITLAGEERTTNHNDITSELKISIINGENIPQLAEIRNRLGKLIAKTVKTHLKDPDEFDHYEVSFITRVVDGIVTKTTSTSYSYSSRDLIAATINIGKKLTSEYGYVLGGSVFTSQDSEIICVLRDFTFTDTSAVSIQLYKELQDTEEMMGENDVRIKPKENYLFTKWSVQEFHDAYGAGKFKFQILSHDSVVASSDFEVK